jgi:hypothetical protein
MGGFITDSLALDGAILGELTPVNLVTNSNQIAILLTLASNAYDYEEFEYNTDDVGGPFTAPSVDFTNEETLLNGVKGQLRVTPPDGDGADTRTGAVLVLYQDRLMSNTVNHYVSSIS